MRSLRKFSELYYRARLNADPQKRETTSTEKKEGSGEDM